MNESINSIYLFKKIYKLNTILHYIKLTQRGLACKYISKIPEEKKCIYNYINHVPSTGLFPI